VALLLFVHSFLLFKLPKIFIKNVIYLIFEMLETLKQLALMNAISKVVKVNSKKLASRINQSHQTAARKLKELEERGLIERVISKDGQYVKITEKGKMLLYKEYMDYRAIFGKKRDVVSIKGEVFAGFGEGKYYMSLENYKRQFIEKLGFEPYPGTLNLKLSKEQLMLRCELEKKEGIVINGFESEGRTFGSVKAFRCRIGDIDGAVILPERTHYTDAVEVVAPVNLRKELGLKNGDRVEVKVYLV